MPEEPERWEKYGFPDPTFYPSYLPFVGLCKALNERLSWYGYQMDLPDYFNGSRDGKTAINYIYEFDTYLALLGLHRYINPDKYDELVPSSNPDDIDIYWTFEDLLLTGADGVEEDIVFTYPRNRSLLAPNWCAKWLRQRYKIINLLKYRPILCSFQSIGGMGLANNSKSDAWLNAVNSSVESPDDRLVGSMECHDPNYAYTTYYCSFRSTSKCWVYPGQQLPNNSDFYLVCNVENTLGDFNSFGLDLSVGLNRIKANDSKVFIESGPVPYPSQWDSQPDYGASWYAGHIAYADFSEFFNFKEPDE